MKSAITPTPRSEEEKAARQEKKNTYARRKLEWLNEFNEGTSGKKTYPGVGRQ
jgi:hypothetical protein